MFSNAFPKCVRLSLKALMCPFALRCPISSPPGYVIVPRSPWFLLSGRQSSSPPQIYKIWGQVSIISG